MGCERSWKRTRIERLTGLARQAIVDASAAGEDEETGKLKATPMDS